MKTNLTLAVGSRIRLITPAPSKSLSGNRATGSRWMRIFESLGFQVDISVAYLGERADAMVALHAWRSARAIQVFKERYPERPVILALTGTDLYRFMHSHPEETLRSIESADHLVALHDLAYRVLPEQVYGKLSVIYQSAVPLAPKPPRKRTFDLCVAGHLREEKDPFRAAYAVDGLPPESRARVLHYGKAHEESWAREAEDLMVRNKRYVWLGERAHWEVRRAMSTSRLMVLSSVMEGGANVVSEAVMAGLPVIASRIDGSVGLLGDAYPGYYPVKDTDALRDILWRCETDPAFLASLQRHIHNLRDRFLWQREYDAWQTLLVNG